MRPAAASEMGQEGRRWQTQPSKGWATQTSGGKPPRPALQFPAYFRDAHPTGRLPQRVKLALDDREVRV